MTKKGLEKLDPADKQAIKELAQKTKERFEQLLMALDAEKYPKDKTYPQKLYQHTMILLDYWLQTQEWPPSISMILRQPSAKLLIESKKSINAGAIKGSSYG